MYDAPVQPCRTVDIRPSAVGTVSTRCSWPRFSKRWWPHLASTTHHLLTPAGWARRCCNLPGRALFVAASDRSGWGQNIFANDLGGAGRTSRSGADARSQNHRDSSVAWIWWRAGRSPPAVTEEGVWTRMRVRVILEGKEPVPRCVRGGRGQLSWPRGQYGCSTNPSCRPHPPHGGRLQGGKAWLTLAICQRDSGGFGAASAQRVRARNGSVMRRLIGR
jgi:hypothetical protein